MPSCVRQHNWCFWQVFHTCKFGKWTCQSNMGPTIIHATRQPRYASMQARQPRSWYGYTKRKVTTSTYYEPISLIGEYVSEHLACSIMIYEPTGLTGENLSESFKFLSNSVVSVPYWFGKFMASSNNNKILINIILNHGSSQINCQFTNYTPLY